MKAKKALSLVLVCTIMLTLGTTILALERSEPTGIASSDPFSSDICIILSPQTRAADLMYSPKLFISSPSVGKISVSASVNAMKTVDKLGFTILEMERWDGNSWVPDATWTNKYSYSTSSFSWSGSAIGCVRGAYYKATCTFYAKIGTQVKTIDVETSYITCR